MPAEAIVVPPIKYGLLLKVPFRLSTKFVPKYKLPSAGVSVSFLTQTEVLYDLPLSIINVSEFQPPSSLSEES